MLAKKKKALSPIIASVLLILLALALFLIIFFWSKGFLLEQIEKNGRKADTVCNDVKLTADFSRVGNNMEIIVSNGGSIPIYAIEIHQKGKGFLSVISKNVSLNSYSQETKVTVSLDSKTTQLKLYPRIVGVSKKTKKQKEVTCSEKELIKQVV